MKDLSTLRIYRLALEISEQVWNVVDKWDKFEKWTIGKQFVDATDGIGATMNEGYYRYSSKDQARLFQYSLASAKETELWLWRAHRRKLIEEELYQNIRQKLSDLCPQCLRYIQILRNQSPNH